MEIEKTSEIVTTALRPAAESRRIAEAEQARKKAEKEKNRKKKAKWVLTSLIELINSGAADGKMQLKITFYEPIRFGISWCDCVEVADIITPILEGAGYSVKIDPKKLSTCFDTIIICWDK